MVSNNDEIRRHSFGVRRAGVGSLKTKYLIAIMVLLGLIAGYWWFATRQSPVRRGVRALIDVYRLQRPLESRISGFAYAPFPSVRSDRSDAHYSLALNRAHRLLLDAELKDPGPVASQALGRFYLAQREFRKAIDQFTRALGTAPWNASLHNDLGVALMEESRSASTEARSGEEIERLAMAVEYFDKALELEPDLPEAIFNRALLHEQMLLSQQAQDGWGQYLKLDVGSPWGEEAREHLKQLELSQFQAPATPLQLVQGLSQARAREDHNHAWKIVSQNRDRISSVVVQELLDNYLHALKDGKPDEAGQFLAILSYVGALEVRMAGDNFTSDLAAYYGKNASANRAALILARDWLKSGIKHLDGGEFENAEKFFAKAMQLFRQTGDIGEGLQTEFLLSMCRRRESEVEMRWALYEKLSRTCRRSQYRHLLTQILMAQVQVQDGLANHSSVIEYSRRGLQIAQEINDVNSSAILLLRAAASFHSMGDYHESLKLYFQGLALTNRLPMTPYIRWAINQSIAFPLNELKRHKAAAEYQQESLRIARAAGSSWQMCRSHINLGSTYSLQGEYGKAIENAQLASTVAESIPDEVFRREHLALASHELGRLHSQSGDFTKAIQSFNFSIRLFEGLNTQQAYRYSAHKGKLIASLLQGEPLSEDDVKAVTDLFEEYRVKIREESNRNSFFDQEQNIYDIAIDFWYGRKKDAQMAFELTERSRARSLLDSVSGGPIAVEGVVTPDLKHERVAPMTPAEIQSRMPEQAQIVQYAVLRDKLLIWVISRARGIVVREQKISESELTGRAKTYLQFVADRPEGDAAAVSEVARQLHDLLIKPIVPLLDKQKTLCLVPDKILNRIPFAALISSDSGRFLIEDYSIQFAPSATMFVVCSAAAAAKESVMVEKLLSVGNPAFDRKAFSLDDVPSASSGAKAIAEYYDHPLIMTGAQATKRRVVNAIDQIDVLHLALHCVVDDRSPPYSKLLFASAGGENDEDEGTLQAYEIYRLKLSRLRLVVLAACRSGVERYYGGEGMVGISRPFIARGIPLVVASLWEADQQATAELMTRFHQVRKQKKMPTSEALREAQLSLLHGSDSSYRHPYYWASFETIGGYARF